jgi:hypothetical protein
MSLRPLVVSLVLLFALPLAAATFTVTSGADSGPGTLRQAILDANANPGRDQIVLQADVTLESSTPDITGPIDITGARTPSGRHEINVNTAVPGIVRLNFAAGSAGSTIDSIVFGPAPFTFGARALHIGTSGMTVTNVLVTGAIAGVIGPDNTIGGPSASDRNDFFALDVVGDRNVVLGNTIGDLQVFFGEDVQIGTAAAGNIIDGAGFEDADSASIRNNTFTSATTIRDNTPPTPGPTIIGNTFTFAPTSPALSLTGLSSGFISNNVFRTGAGIAMGATTTGIEITANDIVTSFGLPIDLNHDGPTPNDAAPDADTGGNSLQNFPVLISAILIPDMLTVEGTLTSAPLTPYRIELFANEASQPDAQTLLRSFIVTTDATGNATFSENITSPLPDGDDVITATATNKGTVAVPGSTPNSTSEVSAPLGVAEPGALGFAVTAQSVDENDGTVTITVTRTGGSDGTVTVDFATSDGTATAPGDYTATSGTLTFGPGVTEQAFTVAIFNDTSPESTESFTVTLSEPTGGAVITTGTTTITITDDDLAAAQVPSLSTWGLIALAMGLAAAALLRR